MWSPPDVFRGETVFVVGGGHSLRGFDFSRLYDRQAIAVNAAGYDLPTADVLFFHDGGFLDRNRDLVGSFRGLVVTTSRYAGDQMPSRVLVVATEERLSFLAGTEGAIKRGRSSGHSAVSLAIAMGASQVVLLGFDCRSDSPVTHYHDRYLEPDAAIYANSFAPAWRGWNEAARRAQVQVVNATPDSAISEFPFVDIDDVL